MTEKTVFEDEQDYRQFIKELKAQNRLHGIVEGRLSDLLALVYPDTHATPEVSGVYGGRNDLMQFFFNGRRVVFELFFSPSQVPQDLRLLEQNVADVKIAVLLDYELDPKLADEYFRKKPDHFPYLWLRQVMLKSNERFCLARLKELIDENHVIIKLRNLLSTPAGSYIESRFKKQIEQVEDSLSTTPPKKLDLRSLNGQQLAALLAAEKVRRLGIPVEKLIPLRAWLEESIAFAFRLVAVGYQAFLITDLKEHYAIWSDGDLADDLILGADEKADGKIVLCLNEIINNVFQVYGIERKTLEWHFFHAYEENIEHIEPAQWLKDLQTKAEQGSGSDPV
jgi:hypothetical protein